MGSAIETWDAVEGAYYTGAGGGMELVWLLISIAMCVVALVIGARHELDAYKQAEYRK